MRLPLLIAGSISIGALAILWGGKQLSENPTTASLQVTPDSYTDSRSLADLLLRRTDYIAQACCASSVQTAPLPDGREALWFRIETGEPLVKGANRAELRFLSDSYDTPVAYQGTVFIPSDWKREATPVLIMQWHGARDRHLLEVGRVPPLEIAIIENEWVVKIASDPKILSSAGTAGPQQRTIATVPMIPGQACTWDIRTVWSHTDSGRLELSLDGQSIVQHQGPNAHRDLVGPYLKLGVYAPKWKSLESPEATDHTVAFLSATRQPWVQP